MPKPSLTRLFKNASIYGTAQLVTTIVGFVTSPILSYLLTTKDFGLLGVTRSISGFLTSFYRLGLDGAANRLFYDVEHDRVLMRRAVGTLNAFLLIWVAVLSVGQELVGPTLYGRLAEGLPYAIYGRFVAYGALCDGLSAIPHALWGAQEQAKRLAVLKVGTTLVSQGLTLGLLLLTNLGVLGVFWAGIITPTLLLALYLPYAYGTYGLAWDTGVLKRALAFGLPMVVHMTSHWVLDAADRLMLDSYLGRDAVGLYTAAYGSVGTLLTINMSINSAYVPQFTRAHGDPEKREFVSQAVTYFLAIAAGSAVVFMIISGTMIRLLYSAKFHASAVLSPVLCASMFFQAVYLVYVNGLFHAKQTKLIPIGTVLAGGVNIGLNVLLIPRFGIRGAAWATLAGYVALAVFFGFGCNLVTRIPFDRARLVRVLAPLGVVAVVAWAVDGFFDLWVEVPIKIALLAIAPAALIKTGFLGTEERAWIRTRLEQRWPRIFRRRGAGGAAGP